MEEGIKFRYIPEHAHVERKLKLTTPEDRDLFEDICVSVDAVLEGCEQRRFGAELPALEEIARMLCKASSDTASLPRVFTFMHPFIRHLQAAFNKIRLLNVDCVWYCRLASVLSVLMMIAEENYTLDNGEDSEFVNNGLCLKYKLVCGELDDFNQWGFEYVKHIITDIVREHNVNRGLINVNTNQSERSSQMNLFVDEAAADFIDDKSKEIAEINVPYKKLLFVAEHVVKFLAENGGEIEACDLSMEIGSYDFIKRVTSRTNFRRICQYLMSNSRLALENEREQILLVVTNIFVRFGCYCDAMLVAIEIFLPFSLIKVLHKIALLGLSSEERKFSTTESVDEQMNEELVDENTNTSVHSFSSTAVELQAAYILHQNKIDWEKLRTLNNKIASEPVIKGILSLDCYKKLIDRLQYECVPENWFNHWYSSVITELNLTQSKKALDLFNEIDERTNNFYGGYNKGESSRNILVSMIGSALMNMGSGNDDILTKGGLLDGNKSDNSDKSSWFYKVKETYTCSAVAMFGLLFFRDPEQGLLEIDKYLYAADRGMRTGALLAIGSITHATRQADDAALAIFRAGFEGAFNVDVGVGANKKDEKNLKANSLEKLASFVGMAISMAGTNNATALKMLEENFLESCTKSDNLDFTSTYALAIGIIGLGSYNTQLMTMIMEYISSSCKDWQKVDTINVIFLFLGYSLLCFGMQLTDFYPPHLVVNLPKPYNRLFTVIYRTCNFAGTGCVGAVQDLMVYSTGGDVQEVLINEGDKNNNNLEDDESDEGVFNSEFDLLKAMKGMGDKKKTLKQHNINTLSNKSSSAKKGADNSNSTISGSPKLKENEFDVDDTASNLAVLGMSTVAMGEEFGSLMCYRLLINYMDTNNKSLRRIVPLAIAMLSLSNPNQIYVDMLSKLSHDNENQVATNAILALGLVAAGTNNGKVSNMLKSLSKYYYKDHISVAAIKVAISLVYTGRGLLTLSPLNPSRTRVDSVALAAMIIFCYTGMITRSRLFNNEQFLLCWLSCAFNGRFLVTVDEQGNQLNLPVRVGTLVDTSAQAGQPRRITGFQTQTTPVLLNVGEAAELADDNYTCVVDCLEGVVVCVKK